MANSPKTIVVVNDFAHVNGGASKIAITSAVGLARRGYNVVFFSAVEPVDSTLKETCTVISTGQMEILQDPDRLRAVRQGLWNTNGRRIFRDFIRSLDRSSTIVHVHGWTKALSSSVVHAALRENLPTILTLHDYFIACPNGGFFDYRASEICTRKPLSPGCISANCDARSYTHKVWRIARQLVQKNIGMVPSGIRYYIAVSDFSRRIVAPFLPGSAVVFRVDNPVETGEPHRFVDASQNEQFVFVGRLAREKGVLELARAARSAGVKILFVGDGEYRESICEIDPSASVSGWVSASQVMEFIKTARAIVLPSLWYETQGLVVAEAAAHGVPAIVSESSAASEMVANGETGLWVVSGDEKDIREKLLMLTDSAFLSKLGRNAYERFWSRAPGLCRHLDELERCYRKMLQA